MKEPFHTWPSTPNGTTPSLAEYATWGDLERTIVTGIVSEQLQEQRAAEQELQHEVYSWHARLGAGLRPDTVAWAGAVLASVTELEGVN
jgi:hypothetical protein